MKVTRVPADCVNAEEKFCQRIMNSKKGVNVEKNLTSESSGKLQEKKEAQEAQFVSPTIRIAPETRSSSRFAVYVRTGLAELWASAPHGRYPAPRC